MFAPKAAFSYGSAMMVDHTPAAAVAGGDVVVINGKACIAHVPIPAAERGSLSIGNAVYRVAKSTDAGTAAGQFASIYWDAANGVATTQAQGNTYLGMALAAAVDADTTFLVWVPVENIPAK